MDLEQPGRIRSWWDAKSTNKRYRYGALLGALLCGAGFLHGWFASEPDITSSYGALGVAWTFVMLFWSRGTAARVLRTAPVLSVSEIPLTDRLATGKAALEAATYAQADLVRDVVDALSELEVERGLALKREDLAAADAADKLRNETIDGLAPSKGLAVETRLRSEAAHRMAVQTRTSLSTHLNTTRQEAVPMSILSIVATLTAGIGDNLVAALLRLFA